MKTIAITGLNGTIGEILGEELSPEFRIIDLYHHTKYSGKTKIYKHIDFDLLKKNRLSKILKEANPDVIVHLAAITHIDKCEKDKKNEKKGIVWKTNVEGTAEIAKFCAENKVYLVFLSTECVFDGKQKYFSEKSKKNPINWYGFTKSGAEDSILSSGAPSAIIRSVVAYHKNDNAKTIYGKILKELKLGKSVKVVTDQMFTPTYTFDIVTAIIKVLDNRYLGIYHVAPNKSISPYDFAVLLARRNGFSTKLVKKTTLRKLYGSSRANLRLPNACLNGKETNKILNFAPSDPKNIL